MDVFVHTGVERSRMTGWVRMHRNDARRQKSRILAVIFRLVKQRVMSAINQAKYVMLTLHKAEQHYIQGQNECRNPVKLKKST